MTQVLVSAAALDRLSTLALDVAQLAVNTEGNATSTTQGDLFAQDQAIAAFMAEREELKAYAQLARYEAETARAMLRQELDSSRVYTEGLRGRVEDLEAESETANAVLKHIADYATELQAAFNAIGIRYYADPETGAPVIECIDINALFGSIGLGVAA